MKFIIFARKNIMSYIYSLYHIVFSTYKRQKVLVGVENRAELFSYIWGIVKNHHSTLVRINGMEEHIHILVELHAGVSISELVRDIKRSSSMWVKESGKFPSFVGWEREYGAFSCSLELKEKIRQYIIHQQDHHKKFSFQEELAKFEEEYGIHSFENGSSE
jgi:putative transposase